MFGKASRRSPFFLVTLGASVFWAVMMGALVMRQAQVKFRPSAYQTFLNKDALLSDQWLGIYFGGTPVGFMHTTFEPYLIRPGSSGYRVSNRTFLNIFMLREHTRIWFDSDTIVDENYQLVRFSADFSSGKHRLNVQGHREESGRLSVEMDSHGRISRRSIPIPRENGVVIASMMSPFQSFGSLKTGARFDVAFFNPFSLEIEQVRITVGEQESISLPTGAQLAFLVATEYRGIVQRAWVNEAGELLKQYTIMGWEIIKEDADVVQRVYERGGKTTEEILDMVSLPFILPQEAPTLRRLTLRIAGAGEEFLLNSHRQRLSDYDAAARRGILSISRELEPNNSLPFPQDGLAELRQATPFIQSEDPLIQETAQAIVSGARDSWEAATRINQWVFKNIRKTPVVSVPSAIDVLKTREGDCNEHTALFTALSRAAGIPTQMNIGLAHTNNRLYYHAWPSVFVGEWVDMDPTFGQDIADATHIRLLAGDLSKQLAIVTLLGRISLEVIRTE